MTRHILTEPAAAEAHVEAFQTTGLSPPPDAARAHRNAKRRDLRTGAASLSAREQSEVPIAAAASHYVELGYAVFPVSPDSKRPLVRWGRLLLMTTGQRLLSARTWWRQWPAAHIGLVVGYGLYVVDIDPRHGGGRDPSWPDTLAASTPSGGEHLFYLSSAPIRNSAGKVAPGVDVRGGGGMVVVPPSAGREWRNALEPVDMPAELETRCLAASSGYSGSSSGSGGEWHEPYGAPEGMIGPGQMHPATVSHAGHLAALASDEDLASGEVLGQVLEFAERKFVPRKGNVVDFDKVGSDASSIIARELHRRRSQ